MLSTEGQIRKMGDAGRKRAEEYFSLEKQISEFETLYEDLIRVKNI